MKDSLYVVDPTTKRTVAVPSTTFFDLNVKERGDLQEWLINHPSVLGEELLLITSEFSRFDKSDKRLDMLLLDKTGSIVIAELKLDAAGTLADQQAVRYAAFCSTMTMDDVIEMFVRHNGTDTDSACSTICQFLEAQELPEINGEPRILLVAGSFTDQELTSTVMWLRKFGIDISCIELTPYRYPGDEINILLVPKTIIPLAEAREYQISVERKERREKLNTSRNEFFEFHSQVLRIFKSLTCELTGPANAASQDYMSVHLGHGEIHYEWLVRRRQRFVDVALHFESKNQSLNLERLEAVLAMCPQLDEQFSFQTVSGPWTKKWSHYCIRIPYAGNHPDGVVAELAAVTMCKLIEETLSAVRKLDF